MRLNWLVTLLALAFAFSAHATDSSAHSASTGERVAVLEAQVDTLQRELRWARADIDDVWDELEARTAPVVATPEPTPTPEPAPVVRWFRCEWLMTSPHDGMLYAASMDTQATTAADAESSMTASLGHLELQSPVLCE